jgi:hypothetical protein
VESVVALSWEFPLLKKISSNEKHAWAQIIFNVM